MKHVKYLAAASLFVPSVAMADGTPTITIACFGSDLALTSNADASGTAQLAAEVLSLGDGRVAPTGSVMFLVDNEAVGPTNGVPLRAGHDPRTGQAAGLASLSLSVATHLHLSPGSHTVTARFIPVSTSGLASSSSNAVRNLRVSGIAVAAAPNSTPAPATPLPTDGVNLAPPSVATSPLQTAAVGSPPALADPKRAWISLEENILNLSHASVPDRLVNRFAANATGANVNLGPVPTAPGFIGLIAFQENLLLSPTGTLFGSPIETGIHNGQTISAGYWLDPGIEAVEGEFFFADPASHNAFVSPNGGNIAVQVINPGGGYSTYVINEAPASATSSTFINTTPAVFVHLFDTTVTNSATGNFGMSTTTNFLSADAKYRLRLWSGAAASLDFTAGLRYADLNEAANIGTTVTGNASTSVVYDPALGLPGSPDYTDATTSLVTTSDTFATHNRFLGPQLGLSGKYAWGQWWISGDAKVALGPMFESLQIRGATNSTITAQTAATNPILLAGIPLIVGSGAAPTFTTTSTSSSTGLFGRSGNWGNAIFAALPSANFKIGYDVIPDVLSLTAGYSAMFLSSTIRPANQINNPNPGNFNQAGFWAQGVTVGLKYRFD